jgi:hypothetical protein
LKLQDKARCPWEVYRTVPILTYTQIGQHRTSREHSAKNLPSPNISVLEVSAKAFPRRQLCAFKASWSVATRRKGRRLVERLPGRLLLHRRRYNWDRSEHCDNDETACPCYTKGLWGGGVDDHGFGRPWRRRRRHAFSGVTWSRPRRPHTALDASKVHTNSRVWCTF